MACYRPLDAWNGGIDPVTGKTIVVWHFREGLKLLPLPCGQCIGCRLERSRQWAMRCLHESSLYSRNAFITLTYDNGHLPEDGSVDVSVFQRFMKRLRRSNVGCDKVVSKDGKVTYPIRFFHCGEYGEKLGRPHYHACLFNFDFADKYLWIVKNGFRLYRSAELEKLWANGHCLIGDVTFDSAAYVARYIMKKITGDKSDLHYVNKDTGVIRNSEYTTMSRRPGIGKGWFNKFTSDVYPDDFVVVNGVKTRPPKYYDALYEVLNSVDFARIKADRVVKADSMPLLEKCFERLAVKEICKNSRVKSLIRPIEVINDN